MSKETIIKSLNLSLILFLIFLAVATIYCYNSGVFSSTDSIISYINSFGVMAPVVFIIFQALQVIVPIIPGGISLVAGVVIFGDINGFIYNYIGIVVGSIGAFLLAKNYGMPIIKYVFGEKGNKKYLDWANSRKFDKLFRMAIFFPIAPDDFLCYLAGTTNMKLRTFVLTILLGKPLSIACYSLGLNLVFTSIMELTKQFSF